MPYVDPTDVVGRRILAKILESVVNAVLSFVVVGAVLTKVPVDNSSDYCQQARADHLYCLPFGSSTAYVGHWGPVLGRSALLYLAVLLVNGVLLEGLLGGSWPKLLLGLRVVKENGTRAGAWRCFVRNLLFPIDGLCCALVGLVAMAKSGDHQRVGDMAGGTFVVPRRFVGQPMHGSPMDAATRSFAQPGAMIPAYAPPGMQTGPQWDESRQAYVQREPMSGRWMAWSDATKQWTPIE